MANGDFDISQVPQLRVSDLLSPNLLACNDQGEKILPVLLLMADLNSGPFSNPWQLVASQKRPTLCMLVIVYKENVWRGEAQANQSKVHYKSTGANSIYHSQTKTSRRPHFLEVLCWFEIMDDFPLGS